MAERRALLVTTAAAATQQQSGATLRVDDVRAVLQAAGYAVTTSTEVVDDGWDLGVAVSYARAGALRALRARSRRTWLDAVDSWLLVDGSGVRAGHPAYALRAVRDGVRLLAAPCADLVTYISAADLRSDRGTVRGRVRLVLPGRLPEPVLPLPSQGRRLVAAGDWGYQPNADGLRWLVREVLPRLAAPVHVYGGGAVPAHPLLVQHGYAADAAELLQQGDVHLAPVRFGGGVKRKVLSPLLAGLPVVATPAAAHGLRAHPLLHITTAAASFAATALACLREEREAAQTRPGELADRDDTASVVRWLSASAVHAPVRRCPPDDGRT